MCWCTNTSDTKYDVLNYSDYVYSHSEYIKIHCSSFFLRNVKKGDIIILKISNQEKETHHSCIIKKITKKHLYVLMITQLLKDNNSFSISM